MHTTGPMFSRKLPVHQYLPHMSEMMLGCMSMGGGWNREPITADTIKIARAATEQALACGINAFDHADIYANGKAEAVFGELIKQSPSLRDQMIIQTKCGIRLPDADNGTVGMYDFSAEHIRKQTEASLRRLNTDRLDILLLHRPDPLIEPEEVASVLESLHQEGKVLHFGVSNMNVAQFRFLQRTFRHPLIINQLEMSLGHLHWLDHGVHVNHPWGSEDAFAAGLIEFSRMENIQLQAWSPLAKGLFSGRDTQLADANPTAQATTGLVRKMAMEKNTSAEAIVLGWLMRHPAGIQPVIGTINPQRIADCADATVQANCMSREEWYHLYVTARGRRLP